MENIENEQENKQQIFSFYNLYTSEKETFIKNMTKNCYDGEKQWQNPNYKCILSVINNKEISQYYEVNERIVSDKTYELVAYAIKIAIDLNKGVFIGLHRGGKSDDALNTTHVHAIFVEIKNNKYLEFNVKDFLAESFKLKSAGLQGFHVEPVVNLNKCLDDAKNSRGGNFSIMFQYFPTSEGNLIYYSPYSQNFYYVNEKAWFKLASSQDVSNISKGMTMLNAKIKKFYEFGIQQARGVNYANDSK